ncbi:MAG: site-specific integrase, partial [Conexibacter sp.]|nr:site-specific integrase [Conexibacter sp.]
LAGMRDGSVLTRSGGRYRPATIRSYDQAIRVYIVPAIVGRRLHDVRRRDIQGFVDRLRADGLGASTIHNKLDPLRVMFRRAVRDDVIAVDPTEGLDMPAIRGRRDRIATVADAEALIDAAPRQDRAMWACAFYAGLRRGELRALRWRHVDFDAGVIRVEDGWDDQEGAQDAKTEAGRRTVPMAGALRRALAAHKLATGRADDDLVFGRSASLPFIPSTTRRRALKAWEAAGLEPLSPHEARHTCASYLIAAGLNPKQVQTYIGHSDIRTTFNIYGHLLPGDEAKAAAQLDVLLDAGARNLRESRPPMSGGS